ncbi:MAG: glutamyl-tRNA reductase [Betaproteobacteria bacterium]
MPLFALGLNHRTAPIDVREAVAFTPEAQRAALPRLQRESGAAEVVLVSTCNRSEIYLRGEDASALGRATGWLHQHAPGRVTDLEAHLYRHHDEAVARHAMRVACGLDSMVLGEPQILGQVKSAVKIATEAGTLGGPLDRLFQQTFSVAKQVRAQTAIGESSVSMGAAAVGLARQLFGDLSRTRLLLIGAGEMIELVAAHFAAHHPQGIAVANRTLERGQALATRIGATAMSLADLPGRIHEFDAVVSCTASTLPIIGKGMVERALRRRRSRPMYFVDLAVPRDIEPEVGELDDVFLQTLDSLGRVTQENSRKRADAVTLADEIIDARVREFAGWLQARAAVPLIRELRSRAEHDRQIELARARQRLARGDDPMQVIEALSSGLANKLLHPPMQALKRASGEERERIVRTLSEIYGEE